MHQDQGGWLLRCGTCGKSVARGMTEMLRFSNEGWPNCCGDVMSLYVKAALSAGNQSSQDFSAADPS